MTTAGSPHVFCVSNAMPVTSRAPAISGADRGMGATSPRKPCVGSAHGNEPERNHVEEAGSRPVGFDVQDEMGLPDGHGAGLGVVLAIGKPHPSASFLLEGGHVSAFEFFTVLLSFVVSLGGVAGMLSAVIRLMQEAPRVRFSAAWALWATAGFTIQINFWLRAWSYHTDYALRDRNVSPAPCPGDPGFLYLRPCNAACSRRRPRLIFTTSTQDRDGNTRSRTPPSCSSRFSRAR